MSLALKVASLDKMEETILNIIVVSLSVLLHRENMLSIESFGWTDLLIPLSVLAVAMAIKLIDFKD